MSDEQESEPADEPEAEEEQEVVAPDADEAEEAEPEADAEAETEEAEEEAEGGLQDGDFIKLAYTARTVEGDELVDTTDLDVAEEEGIDTEEHTFEPRTIILGAGHLFEAVEDAIIGEEVGHSGNVTVPAAEAFGEHDPDQVRTVSADKIPEDNRYPGAHVDIDGQHGHVETVIGGRARVDFNHALAGEDIEYDFEVVDVVDDPLDKAQGLFQMYFDLKPEMHIETDEVEEDDETVEKETLYVESTPQLTMNQQWMFSKQQIAQEIIDRLDIDRVIVQDIIDGEPAGMGGMGGMGGLGDVESALGDVDVDADEILEGANVDADDIAEELEGELEDVEVDEADEADEATEE